LSGLRDYNKYQKRRFNRFIYLITFVLLGLNVATFYSNKDAGKNVSLENDQLAGKIENMKKDYNRLLLARDSLQNVLDTLAREKLIVATDNEGLSAKMTEMKSVLYQKNIQISALEKRLRSLETSASQNNRQKKIEPIPVKNLKVE
jgi:chromosome segregation ATPase